MKMLIISLVVLCAVASVFAQQTIKESVSTYDHYKMTYSSFLGRLVGVELSVPTDKNSSHFVEQTTRSKRDAEWTDEEKRSFLDNCISNAQGNLTVVEANSYCDCMLRKLMVKYPEAASAAQLTAEEAINLANQCLEEAD